MATAERHEIPVRKVSLPFGEGIPRYWFGEHPLRTHFFNGLNLVFPDGERFFVRSVQDHVEQISDPVLLEQIKGFAGQEGRHAHEHERYFDSLRAQGYEIDDLLRQFRAFSKLMNKLPAALRLSATAGAEHYTATLGAHALSDEHLDEAHPTMRKLILWHAIEEVEHKAVAYDVLQATHPSYALRIIGFVLATCSLLFWTLRATGMLMRQDGFSRADRKRMLRELDARDRGSMRKAVNQGLRAYFRRDFHPNQIDDLALAKSRLPEIEPAPA